MPGFKPFKRCYKLKPSQKRPELRAGGGSGSEID